MEITVGRTVNISNPTAEVEAWCEKNLVAQNPEYAKKSRMGFWLGDTPKTLYMYERHGDMLVLPFGTLREILPMLTTKDSLQCCFGEKNHVDYGCKVPLYDYQETAVEELRKAHYGILQSPAGSGKTQMGIALIARLGLRALWITHTRDLLNQSKERAKLYMDSKLIGTITEGKINTGIGVTFATVQTLAKINLSEYSYEWDVVIVDECHRVAGSPTKLTQFYKVLNSISARHKYGLSATVHRADGMIKMAFALLGDVVYNVPDSAVADKIMQVGICPVSTGTCIREEMQDSDGTLNYTKLINALCADRDRNEVIIKVMRQDEEYSSLVLSDRLEHLETLLSLLPADMRKKAVMMSGKMTSKAAKEQREQAIKDMRSGKKRYLFATYALAKEGLDIPRLERLYLTTPQKDYAVVAQSVGRIARTFKGKGAPICYDFVDNIGYLYKSYKKRCTTYKKIRCYFVKES